MGIARAAAELLVEEALAKPFSGRAMGFGRQDLSFPMRDVVAYAKKRGLAMTVEGEDDWALFRALGFDELVALDASDFEGAELVHDLNRPIPDALHGRFDFVFNGGTLEHVFDVRTGLANAGDLVREGGRVVHVAPVSNQIDHGFYCFSPTLLLDWAEANRWTVRSAYVFQARDFESPWTVYAYEPGAFDAITSRFHDVRASGITMAGLWFCIEKGAASTTTAIPQQGLYRRAWSKAEASGSPSREPTGLARAVRDAKRRLDRAFPALNERPMPRKIGTFG